MADFQYKIIDFAPGFWIIEDGGVRCFLIEGEESSMLVDTGFGSGDLLAACRALTDKHIFVVHTHADGDHIGCDAQFNEIYMHPAEFDHYSVKTGKQPENIKPLWQGQLFDMGKYRFKSVHIPGHTPGSVVLLDRANRILIGGDSVQRGAIYMFGPGRSMPAFIASLEKLRTLVPQFDVVLPSHGPLEVKADVVNELIEGAGEYLAGKLTSRGAPNGLPCMLYEYKGVSFLAP